MISLFSSFAFGSGQQIPACREYNESKQEWGWAKPPPVSLKIGGGSGTAEGRPARKKVYSLPTATKYITSVPLLPCQSLKLMSPWSVICSIFGSVASKEMALFHYSCHT